MNAIKFFLTVILLVFSSQSSALFMPADFQLNTGVDVASSDGGC